MTPAFEHQTAFGGVIDKIMRQMSTPPQKVTTPMPDPAKRLLDAGYQQDIAKENFSLLCKAFEQVYPRPCVGVLLTGNVGCGKTFGLTSLVKATLLRLSDPNDRAKLEPYIDEHERPSFRFLGKRQHIILDDLGCEPQKNEYGIKTDVVADYIMRWYTERHEKGVPGRLHATTNLTGIQLIERYGQRVTDRLFSMVIVVQMHGDSRRPKPQVIN